MITSQFSYYVWKMHNLQIIETPKKAKNFNQPSKILN